MTITSYKSVGSSVALYYIATHLLTHKILYPIMKLATILAAIITVTFASCGGGTEGTPVSKTGKSGSKEGLTFKVGEEVKLGDYVIKVNKMEDYTPSDEMFSAKKGMKMVVLEVEYSNATTDKQINANPFDWSASDNKGYSYDIGSSSDTKEPSLNDKTINPGGKVKGWLTFEIPKDSKLTKAQFTPGIIDNVEIEL
jgi:hypothetical protein